MDYINKRCRQYCRYSMQVSLSPSPSAVPHETIYRCRLCSRPPDSFLPYYYCESLHYQVTTHIQRHRVLEIKQTGRTNGPVPSTRAASCSSSLFSKATEGRGLVIHPLTQLIGHLSFLSRSGQDAAPLIRSSPAKQPQSTSKRADYHANKPACLSLCEYVHSYIYIHI
ncbi:hypothetical protein BD289DRAFT_108913 [Coniella lustricola]|uniref:Uncharacterized protein n=1 Tax=Coniella lustricola TaxID=2025994 RepID=A0A2T2ZXK9_9PEZI|nr:hypothetical protein BD289DRAFT_108913 [Coniella lustricola]